MAGQPCPEAIQMVYESFLTLVPHFGDLGPVVSSQLTLSAMVFEHTRAMRELAAAMANHRPFDPSSFHSTN